ncbi:efflux RND transporter permease subunit [Litoribrevibacter albus]|uniref:RND transporter n=1 Tax=Litoribrevibacter albus TaxID=1473156 RepID=A0AA37W7E0_9GAMM|nr:MMPL family transporter [Litoribrevibacter albus]GLQ30341.1 RND transporter [Litoribrevibacter albus]
MDRYFKNIDRFAVRLTEMAIRFRYLVVLLAVMSAVMIGSGGRFLEFANNYRVFFSQDNPELNAFESLQATYSKNDNFLFVLEPADGVVFSPQMLKAVAYLTEQAWQIPFSSRVDSVSNFQHTYAIEDDLVVEDLIYDREQLTEQDLLEKSEIARQEPLLLNQLVNANGQVTAVNVTLQYPEKSLTEVPDAVAFARDLKAQLEADYPGLTVSLTGVSMLNNAFMEAGMNDAANLIPMMFLVIMVVTLLILRSVTATFTTVVVIMLSAMVGMGTAGLLGVKLTPISGSAPVVILTLAIADSIHILMSLRVAMKEGMTKSEGIVEAVRLNFLPVTITSLTTVVGFLALNFSDSPPFWHLGNITALGITAAWLLSITLLPALMSILPYTVKSRRKRGISNDSSESNHYMDGNHYMDTLSSFVIKHAKSLLLIIGTGTAVLIAFIPSIEFNDQWVEYFDERIEFRNDSDRAMEHFGLYPVEFSVPAKGPGGVSEPEFLTKLEAFTEFLRAQPEVAHVYSISDIMKRLNKNLHGDDSSFYRTPDDRELSAQYLLLYELSLPYGLDLNDRINIDKSATRVTATLLNATTAETKAFLDKTDQWIAQNLPDYMSEVKPTSAQVMFTYITERNVNNMIGGTIAAIVVISLIMMIALRDLRLGLLSLVPNGLPILATFGAWAILVGEVGFSVATVASISLGIIVDDTVHFLSKYVRARNERQLSAADSIRYAFRSVGVAILVNTAILIVGFLVLTTSAFKVNADMGLLTALAIGFALILDFLFLPALLYVLDGEKELNESGEIDYA